MKMHAMLMKIPHQQLIYTKIEKPFPSDHQILIKVCSVANLTRKDGEEFLSLAPTIPIKIEIHTYAIKDVNQALDDLRHGRFTGSAVIVI